MKKYTLPLLLLAAGPLAAQPPRAAAIDEGLVQDAGDGFFQRGKNLHDQASQAADAQNRVQLFQKAADIFEQYLKEFPSHPNAEIAWYYMGNSFYMSGQQDNGRSAFLTLLNRYGQGKWAAAAAYTLANDHYGKGEFAFAAPLFERFAANAGRVEDRPRGNYYAGQCYRMLGRDREALTAFKKVIDEPAGMTLAAGAKFYTGQILLKSGKFKEALPLFEEVIANNGNLAKLRGEAALGASTAAAKLDQGDLAEKYLRFLLTTPGLEDFRPDAQTALMANEFGRQQYKEVIDIFKRNTIKAEGEKEAARLMIAGRAYMELKQPSQALTLFRDIETIVKPENEMAFKAAYYRLHCFFQIEGKHVPDQVDGFLQIYQKTRPVNDPLIHTALFIKAETLFANKDNLAAAKAFSEINVDSLSPENRPGLLYKRGWCLAETGDPQGAIRSLTEFIGKYSKDDRYASAVAKRAKCYAEIGESTKALADFDQLTAEGMPQELVSFAWLESARMRRTENNVPDMIIRYKGLLGNASNLSEKLQAEANYWIGWGLVKTNAAADSVSYLEKARKLDADTFQKHAGLLLSLGYFAAQDPQKLAAEINLAIDGKYVDDIPDQTLQWTGMQAYSGNDFASAAKFLGLVANPEDPRETAKEVWRYLTKARLEIGSAEAALVAVNNVLAVEENPGWKADGLVDKGRALLDLGRASEARQAADEAQALRPAGRTSTMLGILSGDLFVKENDLVKAAGAYTTVVEFNVDPDLKPEAIGKLIKVWEQRGNQVEADKYREQLAREFPNWKAR